jgi:ABC-2 type transport system ATP-binding protein
MDIRRIIADLRDRGKTVFFSSHELSEVELVCDHIAILVNGRVVTQGNAGELVGAGESLEQYFMRVVRAATACPAPAVDDDGAAGDGKGDC